MLVVARDGLILFVWFVLFIWFPWFLSFFEPNQLNKQDRPDRPDRPLSHVSRFRSNEGWSYQRIGDCSRSAHESCGPDSRRVSV